MRSPRAFEPLRFTDDELAYLKSRVAQYKATWETERETTLNTQRLTLSSLYDRLNRLTDAFIDGTIEKDLFERRKTALLMEQKELEEKIAGLEANQRTVPDRLAEFLELAGTAYFQYKLALPDEKRDLLEMVTSNRRVNGRNVELTLSLPFSEEKTL